MIAAIPASLVLTRISLGDAVEGAGLTVGENAANLLSKLRIMQPMAASVSCKLSNRCGLVFLVSLYVDWNAEIGTDVHADKNGREMMANIDADLMLIMEAPDRGNEVRARLNKPNV